MKRICVILLLLIGIARIKSYSQEYVSWGYYKYDSLSISPETKKLITIIKNKKIILGQVDSSLVNNLKKTSDIDELFNLLNHPNSTISTYAFHAFTDHDSTGKYPYDENIISKPTLDIVSRIVYDSKFVLNKEYPLLDTLKRIATIAELTELTNHSNKYVRVYSFWALAMHPSINLYPIIIKHLNDYKTVHSQMGSFPVAYYIGDFYITVADPSRDFDALSKLSQQQLIELDSILVNTKNLLSRTRDISKK